VLQVTYPMSLLSISLDTAADLTLLLLASPDAGDCRSVGGIVALPNVDPGTYYIVVDGFGVGAYSIEIRCFPPPQDTPTPTTTLTATPTIGPSPTPTNTRTPGGPSTIYLPVVRRRYPIEFFVNCGTERVYIDSLGGRWLADKAHAPGDWGYWGTTWLWPEGGPAEEDIANTADPSLYQRQRYACSRFGYRFDVPNGRYEVELRFAELWWATSGKRIFDVIIEGQVKLDDYDVYAAAGARFRATVETFVVTVGDGQLNVDFALGSKDCPMINALRVIKI